MPKFFVEKIDIFIEKMREAFAINERSFCIGKASLIFFNKKASLIFSIKISVYLVVKW